MDELQPNLEKEISGLSAFVGTFTHSLDPKKRLTIPAEWRSQVGSPKSLYVLPNVHERCLTVFPASEMVRRLQRMRSHSMADRKAREFARVLASQSDLISWDTQGRIRIKDELLQFAQLVDQVVLVGAFDCFELWSPEYFDGKAGMDQDRIREAAQYVGF
jgi:MraZ protein